MAATSLRRVFGRQRLSITSCGRSSRGLPCALTHTVDSVHSVQRPDGIASGLSLGSAPSQYSPFAIKLPSTHFAQLRAGMHFGAWEIDAFCDNVFNNNAIINYVQQGLDFNHFNPYDPHDLPPAPLTEYYTFQPRTYGITAILSR